MLKVFKIVLFALFLLAAPAAHAQEPAASSSAESTVREADLKRLITTLESETARTELLGNLKLLLEQQNKTVVADEAIAPLTETLGVETFTSRMVKKYQDFLARNDLKGSTVGKIGLTAGATLAVFLFAFFLRRAVSRGLRLVDRGIEWLELPPLRLRFYARALRHVVTIAFIGITLYTYFIIWGSARHNPFEAEWFKAALKTAVNVGVVIVLGVILWETINTLIHVIFKRLGGDSSTRTQTIMPIVRNVLFIVFSILFALVILSELGINIMPLLAGAGIVGVAIGFGAQTMVKDFITGFTIILEDVVRVGDVAKMAGHEGVIEKITLRKIQLRDFSGRVYTIPFGTITTIENSTKDFSFYPMDIGIAYAENTDRVCDVLRAVDEDMRKDPAFAADMMEPIEIVGVDRFADSAVILKARLKTQPLQQWVIGREFNRRMKLAFEKHNIEIPFPQRVVTVREGKLPGTGA